MRNLGPLLVVFLVCVGLLPTGVALEENTDFQPTHVGQDFPVGWVDYSLNGPFTPQVRMMYPSMEEGEDTEMAGNGPFPYLVFIGDSGEAIDGYMLFGRELVERGYIVVVTQPVQDETQYQPTIQLVADIVESMQSQNITNPHVLGSAGNIDVAHWGLSGHGKGATASYIAYPFWNTSGASQTVQPPRALFGLALDLTDVSNTFAWDNAVDEPIFPLPNVGFFVTGTVDEISPSYTTQERVEAIGGLGWQWMHLLGGDHYQFQDSTSIFESDGEPSISQSTQIGRASQHIIAYLDVVLRGDHARFRDAFNRESSIEVPSDPYAYIDENLIESTFVYFSSITINANATTPLNATQSFEASGYWTLRNGLDANALPTEWNVSIHCHWDDETTFAEGVLNETGFAHCVFPMETVAPGTHRAKMTVLVEGAPTTLQWPVGRTDTPLSVLYPLPILGVPQHGSAIFEVDSFVQDPDGQAVRVVNTSLSGSDAYHFSVSIQENGLEIELSHHLLEEWEGQATLTLHVKSDGEIQDEANITLLVQILPVDDPLELISTIPLQSMLEDSHPIVLELSQYVADPENESVLFSVDGALEGSVGPIGYVLESSTLTITPIENATGAIILIILASDGAHAPLEIDLPIQVHPVDDPIVVNVSLSQQFDVDEDSLLTIDVSQLAYDVDGDEMVWSIFNPHTNLLTSLDQFELTFMPSPNVFGEFDGFRLNVTDGTGFVEFEISIDVNAVPDPPQLTIDSVQQVSGATTASIQWSVTDVDAIVNTAGRIYLNGNLSTTNHSCLVSSPISYQCVTLIALPDGEGMVEIALKVHDDELGYDVVITYLYDLTAPTPNNSTDRPTTSTQGQFSIQTIGLMLVLVGIIAVLLMRLRRGGRSPLPDLRQGDSQRATGGLLSRTQQLK